MQNYLKEGIKKIDVVLTDEQIELLIKYLNLLVEYNSHTNLTAIRDPEGILEKHFIDSLLVQKYINENDKTAIDIGTGAGFPGMILAICNPNITLTLIDSVGKKTKFLQMVKEELKLENVIVENVRAEEYINDENRESFSIGLCRGVSKLPTILEYMLPFIEVNGRFLVQKSEGTGEEESAQNALTLLNGKILGEYNLELPFSKDKRKIIIIKKEKETDRKYPRKTGKPLKNPL
ncbi:MAG: 16S rRNA (guanine(527)-N(7))-methyltransferase RsmG [Fusobacteriaceae bacterium]